MKISLINATFYFNPPINLTPLARSLTIDLASLDDSIVRKLNLAVATKVVEITEGEAEFKERVANILKTKSKKPDTKPVSTPVEVKEEVKVTPETPVTPQEDKVEEAPVVEKVKEETPKKTTTTAKKTTTAAKKTTVAKE